VLQSALNQVVARHEILRTTFPTVDEEPVQRISPDANAPVLFTDLAGLSEAERETEARRLADEEAQTGFDLATVPLLRAHLLRLEIHDHVLLLTMHHIVSDAWSTAVFYRELGEYYRAQLSGETVAVPELSVQYADYAVWQRNWLQGEVLENQLAYWKKQLDGTAPLLSLPTDRPRKPQTFRGSKETGAISLELTAKLRSLSQREGATLFMTLLAAYDVLLSHRTGQNDIVVGTDWANRNSVETEKLIGFFINLLPLRARMEGDPSFTELLHAVRESVLGAFAHPELPFEKLVEELRVERDATYNPLVQVLFVMQNTPKQPLQLAGVEVSSFGVKITRSKFDFAVFMVETDQGLSGHWEYSTDLFDSDTIRGMTDSYNELLALIIANPSARITELKSALQKLEDSRRAQSERKFEELGRQKLGKIKRKVITVG